MLCTLPYTLSVQYYYKILQVPIQHNAAMFINKNILICTFRMVVIGKKFKINIENFFLLLNKILKV